jgi:hypothetical protein
MIVLDDFEQPPFKIAIQRAPKEVLTRARRLIKLRIVASNAIGDHARTLVRQSPNRRSCRRGRRCTRLVDRARQIGRVSAQMTTERYACHPASIVSLREAEMPTSTCPCRHTLVPQSGCGWFDRPFASVWHPGKARCERFECCRCPEPRQGLIGQDEPVEGGGPQLIGPLPLQLGQVHEVLRVPPHERRPVAAAGAQNLVQARASSLRSSRSSASRSTWASAGIGVPTPAATTETSWYCAPSSPRTTRISGVTRDTRCRPAGNQRTPESCSATCSATARSGPALTTNSKSTATRVTPVDPRRPWRLLHATISGTAANHPHPHMPHIVRSIVPIAGVGSACRRGEPSAGGLASPVRCQS